MAFLQYKNLYHPKSTINVNKPNYVFNLKSNGNLKLDKIEQGYVRDHDLNY